MLAQMKAIRLRAVRKRPETLDPALLKQVVKDDFKLIEPMIDACRKNDRVALNAFDDLLPFREHVIRIFGDATKNDPDQPAPPGLPASDVQTGAEGASDVLGPVRAALAALGLAPDVVEVMLRDALAEDPSMDALQLVAAIGGKLKAPAETPKPRRPKKVPKPEQSEWPLGDLRRIVSEGKQQGLTAYDALKACGAVGTLPEAA